jgi:hypothetical protein
VTVLGDTIIADIIYGTVIAGGFTFLLCLADAHDIRKGRGPQLPRDDAYGDGLTATDIERVFHCDGGMRE